MQHLKWNQRKNIENYRSILVLLTEQTNGTQPPPLRNTRRNLVFVSNEKRIKLSHSDCFDENQTTGGAERKEGRKGQGNISLDAKIFALYRDLDSGGGKILKRGDDL